MNQTCTLDGVSFQLKEAHDFSFLRAYGRVFKVFDDQDSGNICFGCQKGGERFFIKYAGAKTMRGCVSPEAAADNLRKTVLLYTALQHENLIELLDTFETSGGFGMVFCWTDAQCMGRQYPEAHARFMQMENIKKLDVFAAAQRFMAYVHSKGYVAIDFYDGSIMYDFASGQTLICDIDFFRPKPCVNDMGRMWGSSRFQAPEEYRLGADIDERTNVYTLGALAFALFAGYQRTPEHWQVQDTAFEIARKATSDDPACRQPSIWHFMQEWQMALANMKFA